MLKRIYNNFLSINHNARISITVDPLFTIPITMFSTYQSIYMNRLGLSAEDIGFITSIGTLASLINSIYAGLLTNKYGRKRIIMIFDILSWSLACLVWAFSNNFISFLIAALLNSLVKIAEVAWRCILVDDSRPEERIKIYTYQNIVFVLGSLSVPLGGILVSAYGVIHATRIIYLTAAISTLTAILIRNAYLTETKVGIEMMRMTKNSEHNALHDISGAIKYILTNKVNLTLLIIVVINNFQLVLKSTYYNLYMSSYLKISDYIISIFPGIGAIITMIALYAVLPRLSNIHEIRSLLYGLGLTALSNLVFVLTPPKGMLLLILSTLIGAFGSAIMGPYLDTCWANSIDDNKRANVISYSTILITLISIPAGAIGGYIYTLKASYLFILIFMLMALMFMLCSSLVRYISQNKPT